MNSTINEKQKETLDKNVAKNGFLFFMTKE